MKLRQSIIASCFALGLSGPAVAHPHIFVDAELEVVFDEDGTPKGVWISWAYDQFFSMMLISDLGLDTDFTGELAEEERAELDGFDMNWIEDYHGDTHATQDGEALALSGPVEWASDYRDGQLTSRHLRLLEDQPDPAREWVLAVYDPTYYTSYGIVGTPQATGRSDCTLRVFEPDWTAAGAQLEAALDEVLGAGGDAEADFPAVGALFAVLLVVVGLIYLAGGGMDQITLWAQSAQRGFQDQMALGLRALRAGQPGALATFWGLCFAYGFVHAVGPGHGKFLLGAYGAGSQAPLGRMVGIGLASSLAQGLSAIVLVYAGVLIFDASREAMQITGDIWLERASLIAIALIGLWLVSRAARKMIRQTMAAPVIVSDQNHGISEECGHRHSPDMHEVARAQGWRDIALLVGAIAIRPCTGALFVLILTWRMGLVWQGIAAVLVMALGTAAVTIAVAATAVLARDGTLDWADKLGRARAITPVLEGGAGLFILFAALNMLKIS